MNQSALRFALQRAVQAGPTFLIDLPPQALLDLQLGARPKPFGRQFRGPSAHPLRDVVAGNDQVLARIVFAAQHDVRMRVVGVPVVHRHPVQVGPQIGFHAAHQVAGIAAQVVELLGILRRDDKAELVAVFPASFLESRQVGAVRCRSKCLARFAIATHAFALDVAQVRGGRARSGLLEVHQPGLDGDAPRSWLRSVSSKTGGHMPPPKACARPRSRLAHRLAASLADLLQNLGNELLLTALGCAGADAETVIVTTAHGMNSGAALPSPAGEAR